MFLLHLAIYVIHNIYITLLINILLVHFEMLTQKPKSPLPGRLLVHIHSDIYHSVTLGS